MSLTNPNSLTTKEPATRKTRLGHWDKYDALWVLFIALVVIADVRRFDGLIAQLGFLLLGLVWLGGMQQPAKWDERVYMIPFVTLLKVWNAKVKHGELLVPTSNEGDTSSSNQRKRRRQRALIPLEIHGFGDLGLPYHTKKHTHSLIFRTTGSPTVAKSLEGQFSDHEDIAALICKGASVEGARVTVSMGVKARPESTTPHWKFLSEFGEPAVLNYKDDGRPDTELSDFEKRLRYLHDEVSPAMFEIYDVANDIDMIFVITVAQSEAFRQALKQQTITQAQVNRQSIVRIKKIVEANLKRMGWADVHALDPTEAELYLRRSWDVVNLHDFNYRALMRELTDDTSTDNWYPEHVHVGHSYVEIDGNFGATLKVVNGHRSPLPHEPRSLYASENRWFAAGIIGEAIRGGLEYNVLNIGRAVLADLIDILGVERTGPKVERKEREAYNWLTDIDASNFTISYNKLIAVTAASLEELEDRVQAEVDRLAGLGVYTARVLGNYRQLPAYLTATTLIDIQ